jgi:hypothetical protein
MKMKLLISLIKELCYLTREGVEKYMNTGEDRDFEIFA